MRLAEVIGRFLGKVEVVLAGADDDLRQGEESLATGDAIGARAAAHRVLVQAPDSPLGLALLADACEAAHLDAELAMTLEELARRAPSSAEVWVRLARARGSTGAPPDDVREPLGRALAVAEPGSEARIDALLGLADLDLAQGDGARAELWLERAAPLTAGVSGPRPVSTSPAPTPERSLDIAVRAAEARMLGGDPAGARAKLEGIVAPATDGRAALVRGRALAALGDAGAFVPLIRAMVLDMPGASEALSSAIAYVPSDPQTRTRVRSVIDAKGEQALARWRAAFGRAEGERDAARIALREALASGDRAAARPLLDAAIEDRDVGALRDALAALPEDEALLVSSRHLVDALPIRSERAATTLDALVAVTHPRLVPWAKAIAEEVAALWIPGDGTPAAWAPLLARLDARAHGVGDLDAAARVGELAAERSRPVRLAIVGEFNAGKSTFINALIGADVAPTGVLPTTATLHHLRWAPDPFAKILFADGHEPRERVVPLADLRSALKSLGTLEPGSIERVELRLPLASLVSVEILDTPGFNAPDKHHANVARSAFEEADAAIWLLDATQAMKQSERAVLDEARRLRLPVQMFVNKADRLSASDLVRVMDSVAEALETTKLGSWGPPLAFSAKRALASRLGTDPTDAEALATSGWPAVQALLDEQVVGRSAELKERALRRRAATLVHRLLEAWTKSDAADRAATVSDSARKRAAAQAAARIERDVDAITEQVAGSLAGATAEWARDLELVFIGRDRITAERDPVLARYRVDRAVAAIGPALGRALSALTPEVENSAARVAPCARAAVRAAAWCDPADHAQLLSAIARTSIVALVEQLLAMSVPTDDTAAVTAAGVLRELEALYVELGR